jgi:hypothetical protein
LGKIELMETLEILQSRRAMLRAAFVVGAGAGLSACVSKTAQIAAAPIPVPPSVAPIAKPSLVVEAAPVRKRFDAPDGIRPELFRRARSSFNAHSGA